MHIFRYRKQIFSSFKKEAHKVDKIILEWINHSIENIIIITNTCKHCLYPDDQKAKNTIITPRNKEAANGDTAAGEDDGAGTSCLGAAFVAGESGVAPPPEAGGEDDDGGVEPPDPAASTLTSNFMPPLQWPMTEQMK